MPRIPTVFYESNYIKYSFVCLYGYLTNSRMLIEHVGENIKDIFGYKKSK
jgi:hypothetical protein